MYKLASQSAEYTTWTCLQSCQVENLGRTLTRDVEFTHRVAQRTYASLHKSAFALLVTYNYDAYYIEFPPQYWWKKSGILRGMHEHKYSFIIFPRPLGNEEFSFSIFPPINFILKGNIDEEEKDYVCFEDF